MSEWRRSGSAWYIPQAASTSAHERLRRWTATVIDEALTANGPHAWWFYGIRTPPLGNIVGWLSIDDRGRRELGLPARRNVVIEIGFHREQPGMPALLQRPERGEYSVTDIAAVMKRFAAAGGELEINEGELEIAGFPREEDS